MVCFCIRRVVRVELTLIAYRHPHKGEVFPLLARASPNRLYVGDDRELACRNTLCVDGSGEVDINCLIARLGRSKLKSDGIFLEAYINGSVAFACATYHIYRCRGKHFRGIRKVDLTRNICVGHFRRRNTRYRSEVTAGHIFLSEQRCQRRVLCSAGRQYA